MADVAARRMSTTYDVAVVGAGFAGLSAAVRLARGGARVIVLEARGRLGGRATAFADRETGDSVDNGQHVLAGCYRETFSFLSDIGAMDGVQVQSQLAVTMIDRRGRRTRLTCPPLPAPFNVVAGVLDWDALPWTDRISVLRMVAPLRVARQQLRGGGKLAASPGETVENWLVRNGQTARLREMLWNPLALATLNQSPDRAAAPVFARVLAEMFSSDSKSSSIVVPTRPLDELYAEPARSYVESRGGDVLTGATARVHLSAGEVACVIAGTERFDVRRVIAAVPWFAVGALFVGDTEPLAGILSRAASMDSSAIVSVNLWFDRPIIGETFVGLPGRPLQWVFERPSVSGDNAFHLSLVASGAETLVERTNRELIDQAQNDLFDAIPAARRANVLRAGVVREPRATFSLAPNQPSRPETRTPIAGLYLAGDWIDTGLPGTIESAVRSGHKAAAEAWTQ